jgi:Zn-dependent protease with chaperone function
MAFQAEYYDGVSARAKVVWVSVETGAQPAISFVSDGETQRFNLIDLYVQAKLGGIKRLIDLPDGGRLEAKELSELEAAMPTKTNIFWRGLHYVENHLGWVFASMVFTVIIGWSFLQYGVPAMAEYVAKATPPEMEAKIGDQVLTGLDSKIGYFSASKTPANRKASLEKALGELCTAIKTCPQYRLEFRDGGVIGANAFALPGGIMVVTDQIVTLSKNDTELVAVLAHELGHVKQRHAYRQSIQGVLSGLIFAAITGDVSSIASGLPAALMQMKFSRQHETEADNFALAALQKACLPPKAFADILQRLEMQMMGEMTSEKNEKNINKNAQKLPKPIPHAEKKHERESTENQADVGQMMSTHPDTHERIKPFIAAKQTCTP